MKKLAIVITRYNEDLATLTRLLDSLARQTMPAQDIEVIVSDDGLEAPSIALLRDKYAFRIYHASSMKKSVSHARNVGFKAAHAKYVMFCDCDDMFFDYNLTGLERAIEKMDEEKLQVLRSVIMYEAPSKSKNGVLSALTALDEDDELELVKAVAVNGSVVHGKIFSLEFVKEIGAEFCDDLSVNEEPPFVNYAYGVAERKADVTEPFYIWKYNKDSVTRTISSLYPINCLDQYAKASAIWNRKTIEYDKKHSTCHFNHNQPIGTLVQMFYWLSYAVDKYKDMTSFKEHYDVDIDEAATFYAEFKDYVTDCNIYDWRKTYVAPYSGIADKDAFYRDFNGWLLKLKLKMLHDQKSRT